MSYEIAIVHAALGQIDEACAALRRAPDDHSQTLGWLRWIRGWIRCEGKIVTRK